MKTVLSLAILGLLLAAAPAQAGTLATPACKRDLQRRRLSARRGREAEQPEHRNEARRDGAAIPAAAAARQYHCNLRQPSGSPVAPCP